MPAASVKESIRANVGARPWDRDAIDTRIVDLALSGGGAIINSEADVGGYPVVTPTQAPFVENEWDLRFMIPKAGFPDAGSASTTDASTTDAPADASTTDAGTTDAPADASTTDAGDDSAADAGAASASDAAVD